VEVANPEALLAAYDARVMEAIEERLHLESATIDMGNGRRVLAIRVPTSTRKPHSVRHQGHIYFPSRRERQRYHMTVREIKEMVLRTTSHLQSAKEMLEGSFLGVVRSTDVPYLMMGIVPVFFEDFLVDVRDEDIRQSIGNFNRMGQPRYSTPTYTFEGLERHEQPFEFTVTLNRTGLLRASVQLPLLTQHQGDNHHVVAPAAIDSQLRAFISRAKAVYEVATISGPYLLGMMTRLQRSLCGAYAATDGPWEERTAAIPARDYRFPWVQVDDLSKADELIRPLCDQAHQMFGRERSPSFSDEGVWIGR
jgi:hypothetical protein